jgi:UDP-N-acetylmuramoyl-L-alanyl-D-glutamate--2,6-diaminopimelate ligase
LRLEVKHSDFRYISDNSKEIDEYSAFLITQSSKRYIDDAEKNGAKVSLTPYDLHDFLDLDIEIIGVTGTNGKTTTSAIIYSLLLDLGYSTALLGTRGFFVNDCQIKPKGLTTPSLFELYMDIAKAKEMGCRFFVMEVSSHAIAQERIEGLKFALKIITNITQDHLDYHKSLDEYIAVKNSFLADESPKLINKDDVKIKFNPTNALTYSLEHLATFQILAYSLHRGVSGVIRGFSKESEFHSNLFGLFNIYNILTAISAVSILTKRELDDICECIENFEGVAGRVQIVSREPLVIVDFAHTPDGIKNILETFMPYKLVVVFGAGGDRDRGKRALMGEVVSRFAKRIIVTSDNPRSEEPMAIIENILSGIKNKDITTLCVDREEAIKLALSTQKDDEIVLILGKGDEDYQIFKDKTIHFSDVEVVEKFFEVSKLQ